MLRNIRKTTEHFYTFLMVIWFVISILQIYVVKRQNMVNVIFSFIWTMFIFWEAIFFKKREVQNQKRLQNDQLITNKKWTTHLSPVQYPRMYRGLSQLLYVFGLTVVYKS